ncbi:conserved membrane hypothetical protein [uncultured Stenotrophomonas sp.]|uniref:Transmembrane protein n=1 Tax=uncultured Stenotrophomonas sp. TaxID=165438 RepID=A0A1Y5Q952_9GAMM|nr:conserved membrane hypothetical protein [uncultured Stenotrophomonas sp.]
MTVAIAALHFLLAFILVACLVAELVLLKALPERTPFPALAKIDALYGLSAGLLVAVGLYRAINFEKGWAYYSHSLPFLIKLGLFAAIAVASIYPTIHFFRARHGDKRVDRTTIDRIRRIVHLELALVGALIVCASLAAKGVGVFT